METASNDDQTAGESKTEVTLRLKKGQIVRIQSVAPDPEAEIMLVADDRDGSLKTSRNPASFPVEIVPSHDEKSDSNSNVQPGPLGLNLSDWSYPAVLFVLSLGIYLLIRTVRLAEYPIFFFSDEAMPVIRAQEFLGNGFRNRDGVFFPTFFRNTFQFSLSTTVYLQAIGYVLFGKTVFVTRLISMLSTLPAAVGIGLLFKQVYKAKHWWAATLMFSLVPAWFLHSRTAFETVTAVSLYALFVYFYFRYRQTENQSQLYLALISGALCFYTYNPARLVIVLSGFFLFLSDIKFHWNNRSSSLIGLALLVLLVLPYFRHQWLYPQSISEHLYGLGSYWVRETPLTVKFRTFFQEYIWGLNPLYWYRPTEYELVRHHMLGYGHLSRFTLPFAGWGLAVCFYNFRKPHYRNLILLLLAAPAGAALVDIYITRALFVVVPMTLITAVGLFDCVERLTSSQWFQQKLAGWLSPRRVALLLFVVLSFFNVRMGADALTNGATWYEIYGLGGLQYGAREVFGKTADLLEEVPGRQIYVSSVWTNGTDTVARFFFEEPLPFDLVSIKNDHLKKRWPMTDDTLFILTREEYELMLTSNKFNNIGVEDTILWPNGVDGFFVVSADYVPNIDEIFAQEAAERRKPLIRTLSVSGQPATVTYPRMDIGDIDQLFDGDELTLARTEAGNPATIIVEFENTITASGLRFNVGNRAADITATLLTTNSQTVINSGSFQGTAGDSIRLILFDQSYQIDTLTLLIQDPQQGEIGHVHLWEIELIDE